MTGGDFDRVAVERFGVFILERCSLDPAFSGCLPKLIYRDLRPDVFCIALSSMFHPEIALKRCQIPPECPPLVAVASSLSSSV